MSATEKDLPQKELRFQLTVTRAMLGTLELDQILYIILSGITHGDGLGFNRAFLFLADEGSRELRASTAIGPADDAEAHRIWEAMEKQQLDLPGLLQRFEASAGDPKTRALASRLAGFVVPLTATAPPVTEGDRDIPLQALVARCAQQREPFVSESVQAIYQSPPGTGGKSLQFAHLAMVPLVHGDTLLGVILADNVHSGSAVTEEMLRGLITLGNLAAIAIERARLHQRLKEMAALDGLTGVFNRRHYEMRLAQEVARAQRAGRALSLLLFDIDHFKRCNDTQGHEVGDRVLKELASLLRDRVRTEDMVARYGGEEFVVLLTGGATAPEALKVAEKLRQAVAEHTFAEHTAGDITVSTGVCNLPADQLDSGQLFHKADMALYQAKQAGRNRVVAAT